MSLLRALLLLAALLLTGHQPAMAQESQPAAQERIDPGKLLVPRKNADGTRPTISFWDNPGRWVISKQQQFYGAMSSALRRIKSEGIAAAASTLLLLSFAYGVFHAAGPGHGKTVVSAWLLATENDLKRGTLIAFLSSIIQALSAIVLVGGLLLLVSGAAGAARNMAMVMESASYAMIAAMGAWLVWTAFRMLLDRQPAVAAAAEGPDFSGFQPQPHSHAHLARGETCSDCGHAHAPSPADLRGDWSLAKAFSMAFAIGIRPCTGAILVLILSNVLGLFWIGVVSTFAMAFGTFLTVSAIAALSVYARKLAIRLASGNDRWLAMTGLTLRFGGGLLIAFLGLSLFIGSLSRTGGMV